MSTNYSESVVKFSNQGQKWITARKSWLDSAVACIYLNRSFKINLSNDLFVDMIFHRVNPRNDKHLFDIFEFRICEEKKKTLKEPIYVLDLTTKVYPRKL